MKRPIYLIVVAVFILEKLIQNYSENYQLISSYADDILFIPILMGTALIVQQKWVRPNFVFSKFQVIYTWFIFSVFFEFLIPAFSKAFTKDLWDLAAYGAGAFLFYFLLNQTEVKVKE